MKTIIVCIKQIPDTTHIKIDPVTHNLIREGVDSIMNPDDRTAIEMALELKENTGAEVIAVSMGPMQAKDVLREALELGADRAVLLCDRKVAGSDTLATGYCLSEVIKRLKGDLILCGSEALDGCTGQVGPQIAENLKIPSFTYVEEIKELKDNIVVISRIGDKTMDTYQAHLPLLLCVKKRKITRKKNQLVKKRVELWNASELDEERIGIKGSPTQVVTIRHGSSKNDYLHVPYDMELNERMEYIFCGGMEAKKAAVQRGNPQQLAEIIYQSFFQGAIRDENQ